MEESLSASARPEDQSGPHEVAMTVGFEALDRFERAYASMLASAPDARRACFVPSCEGCPLADTDPHRWTIACSGPRG